MLCSLCEGALHMKTVALRRHLVRAHEDEEPSNAQVRDGCAAIGDQRGYANQQAACAHPTDAYQQQRPPPKAVDRHDCHACDHDTKFLHVTHTIL